MPPAPAPAKTLNWRHSIQQSPDHAALLHAGRQNKEENCTSRKRTNKVSLWYIKQNWISQTDISSPHPHPQAHIP